MFLTKTSEFFTANLFARPFPFYSFGKASKIMRGERCRFAFRTFSTHM